MTSAHPPATHARPDSVPNPGYETRDASASGLLWFGGGLVAALVVVMLLMFAFYALFKSERPRRIEEHEQSNIYQQLRDLHRDEDAALSKNGWVDRKAGVVQIKISRAIDLLAERGLPPGKGPKTELEMNSHAGTPASLPPAAAEKDARNPPERTGPKP
jgi:hypothetical protein